MSSNDRKSQEKLSETVDLMRREAGNVEGKTEVSGRTGRVSTVSRKPSIPKGDKR